MKKITIVLISILAFSTGFAQTQKGFVRTIGRYYDDKHSNAIHRVAGANVVINDRTVVTCDEDGDFKLEPESLCHTQCQYRRNTYRRR